MDPTIAATRVAEAHDFLAAYISEHGKGPFAQQVRDLTGVTLSPQARDVRDASALAAVVEILSAKTATKRSTTTKKGA